MSSALAVTFQDTSQILWRLGTHCPAARSRAQHPTTYHQCFGGTSGAAPAVTAAAVLAETWFWYKLQPSAGKEKPSPAMIKAMLIGHTEDLIGGFDWDGSVVGRRPSLPQGWGRVNIDGLFQLDTAVVVLDQDKRDYEDLPNGRPDDARRFTVTGQPWWDRFEIDNPAQGVTVVMVYTDRFAWQGATPLTVNDLDLKVTQLSLGIGESRVFWGNNFDPDGYSHKYGVLTGSTVADGINTVEVIRIRAAGLTPNDFFTIHVQAAAISLKAVPGLDGDQYQPNQDFALYVYNAELVPDQ